MSVDDSEILEYNQEGAAGSPAGECFVEMGGVTTDNTDHIVTEAGIRGMYRYYREVMDTEMIAVERAHRLTVEERFEVNELY